LLDRLHDGIRDVTKALVTNTKDGILFTKQFVAEKLGKGHVRNFNNNLVLVLL
jgi:hypothetical protein